MQPSSPSQQPTTLNPIQEPQLMPLSYALPLWQSRFSTPAASAYLPQAFLELIFDKR